MTSSNSSLRRRLSLLEQKNSDTPVYRAPPIREGEPEPVIFYDPQGNPFHISEIPEGALRVYRQIISSPNRQGQN